jgi:hypothetical protein
MKNPLLNLLIVTLALTGCTGATIDMPTDWAKLGSGGYINSGGTYDLGHVFVWDTKTNSVQQIYKIDTNSLHDVTIDTGGLYSSYTASVSKDTEMDVTADTTISAAVTAAAKAKLVNSTNVTLTNFNIREFQDPTYALNSPGLRPWRESLLTNYPQFATSRYRFIFIAGVNQGDKIDISFKHDNTGSANANILKVGNFTFDVTYNDDTEATLAAKNQAPLVITPYVYSFKADTTKTPTGLQFYLLLNSGFNFQKFHP